MFQTDQGYTGSEQVRQDLLRRFEALCAWARPTLSRDCEQLLRKAFFLALDTYIDRYRLAPSATPFHAFEVAIILIRDMKLGVKLGICALLYSTIHTLDIPFLEKTFGAHIAQVVAKLDRTQVPNTTHQSDPTVPSVAPGLKLAHEVALILLKLADHLHQMRTLDSLYGVRKASIANKARGIYAPIAHRLRLHAVQQELEDLHLKYFNETTYDRIEQQVQYAKGACQFPIQRFQALIYNLLRNHGLDCTIHMRVKSVSSIYKKMQKLRVPFDQIYDLFAIRIVVDAPPEQEKQRCWQIYDLITAHYPPHRVKLRNWISYPRSNGYTALHTTVRNNEGDWVEVQIRSKRMHTVAEQGHAAHWKYKEEQEEVATADADAWLDQISRALAQKAPAKDALDFLEEFFS